MQRSTLPRPPLLRYFACLILTAGCPFPAMGSGGFSFTTENDLFGSAGTDRYFTNGVNLNVVADWHPAWLVAVADLSHRQGEPAACPENSRVNFTVGQDIYTPQDIEERSLIADDRPYAGWLYLGMGIHDRTPPAGDAMTPFAATQDSTELIAGMIGPQSYAGDVQYWWHENVIGFSNTRKPSGWDNQLKNELAFALLREHKWRRQWVSDTRNGVEADLIPHLGMAAGTLTTYLAAGAEARVGWRLPDDFGSAKYRSGISPSRIAAPMWHNEAVAGRTDRPGSFHLFAKVEGRAVLHDIFLDGNTFTDSHTIDRKPLIYSFASGGSLLFWEQRLELNYTHVYQSKEFEGQPLAHIYGAVTVSCYW